MTLKLASGIEVGDLVEKTGGDYYYKGIVISVFYKLSGVVRYVVENPDGLCFIFNETSLTKVKETN